MRYRRQSELNSRSLEAPEHSIIASAMSIGVRLRTARESRGRKISEVAVDLRISSRYLKAIEEDRFDELPGDFFSRAFVRQYASYLEIDEREIRDALDRSLGPQATTPMPGEEPRKEVSGLPPLPRYAKNRRSSRTLLTGLAGLVVVVVICALVYQYWRNGQEEPVSAVLVDEPPPSPALTAEAHTPAPIPTPPPPPAPMEAAKKPEPEGPLYLQIEADEEVWVKVTSGNRELFSGTLQAGDTKELSGLKEARLVVGNAGGLRVYSNGKSVGPIGLRGHVRMVRLTPDSAEITKIPQAVRPKPDVESEPATTEGAPSA